MDVVDRLFVAMFDSLNEKCKKEFEAIGKQYPFEPLKVIILIFSLRLKYCSHIFGNACVLYVCLYKRSYVKEFHLLCENKFILLSAKEV